MTMLNLKVPKKWILKYSDKPIFRLTPNTVTWYKWCQKVGRRKYLDHSRKKTKRFEKKHPGNLFWRVFKWKHLKDKDLSPQKLSALKRKIEKEQSMKGVWKYVY